MKFIVFLLIPLIALAGISFGEKVRYDNYKVVQFRIENAAQLQRMQNLESDAQGVTFLDSPVATKKDLEAVISPAEFPVFEEAAKEVGMDFKVMEDNFQRLLDIERPARSGRADRFDWTSYNTLEEIYEWLDVLGTTYPDKVTLVTIGQTYEKRPIRLAKISSGKPDNRAIFIEANIHAREWISSATATYLIYQLLTSTDPAMMDLAENIDWFIIPVMNPDGFSYSHTDVRLWRKTRSQHSLLCRGVDPNRNFGYNWMIGGGASMVKCSNTYAGPQEFSESETQALVDYYSTIYEQVDVYLAFHSNVNMLLYPYGHTVDPAPNAAVLHDIAEHAVNELAKKYSTVYEYGSTFGVLYTASGISVDHMYGGFNTPIAYTYEFRDPDHGFILPPEYIIPNCEEVVDSLIGLVSRSREHGYLGGTSKV